MNGQLFYIIITAMRDQNVAKSPSQKDVFDEAYDIAFERVIRDYENYSYDDETTIGSWLYEDEVREQVAKRLQVRRYVVQPKAIKDAVECAIEDARSDMEFAKVCADEKQYYLNGGL